MMEISWHMIFGRDVMLEKEQLSFCEKVAYCDKLSEKVVKLHTIPLWGS